MQTCCKYLYLVVCIWKLWLQSDLSTACLIGFLHCNLLAIRGQGWLVWLDTDIQDTWVSDMGGYRVFKKKCVLLFLKFSISCTLIIKVSSKLFRYCASGPRGLCSRIVSFCRTEAGLTSKCGRISPADYWWYQNLCRRMLYSVAQCC